jgi:hypothetical protein
MPLYCPGHIAIADIGLLLLGLDPVLVIGLAGVGVAFKLCHALLKAGRAAGRAAPSTSSWAWIVVRPPSSPVRV